MLRAIERGIGICEQGSRIVSVTGVPPAPSYRATSVRPDPYCPSETKSEALALRRTNTISAIVFRLIKRSVGPANPV
jgi:hypothetical protein